MSRHSRRRRKAYRPPTAMDPKQAENYLAGNTPGVMDSYSPTAHTEGREGWVETAANVEELVQWRQYSIH